MVHRRASGCYHKSGAPIPSPAVQSESTHPLSALSVFVTGAYLTGEANNIKLTNSQPKGLLVVLAGRVTVYVHTNNTNTKQTEVVKQQRDLDTYKGQQTGHIDSTRYCRILTRNTFWAISRVIPSFLSVIMPIARTQQKKCFVAQMMLPHWFGIVQMLRTSISL